MKSNLQLAALALDEALPDQGGSDMYLIRNTHGVYSVQMPDDRTVAGTLDDVLEAILQYGS
jgi:hypothetical protein